MGGPENSAGISGLGRALAQPVDTNHPFSGDFPAVRNAERQAVRVGAALRRHASSPEVALAARAGAAVAHRRPPRRPTDAAGASPSYSAGRARLGIADLDARQAGGETEQRRQRTAPVRLAGQGTRE
jgi:hypothetical protein